MTWQQRAVEHIMSSYICYNCTCLYKYICILQILMIIIKMKKYRVVGKVIKLCI